MPSNKPLAVAVAVLVLASGCAMLSGGGGDAPATTADAPDHHQLVLGAHTGGNPYGATVTVTRDGDQVFAESFESDGNGTYANLTRFDEPGPYTVTVNTTLPDATGDESTRFRVAGDPGNATAIRLSFRSIEHATFALPRRSLGDGLTAISDYRDTAGDDGVELDVRVDYRGDRIAAETTTVQSDGVVDILPLERTGVYYVAVRAADGWQHYTVVVDDPAARVSVEVDVNGYVDGVDVWGVPP